MKKTVSSCVLLCALARAQTVSSTSAVGELGPVIPKRSDIALDAAVITIHGLCENSRLKTASGPECKTVITRSEFERVIGAVQPDMKLRARREFAGDYVDALVMAKRAEELGLDKDPAFEEQLRIARIQLLTKEMKKTIQRQAGQISDADVIDYYQRNRASFEEADIDRLHIPKTTDRAQFDNAVRDTDKTGPIWHSEPAMSEVANALYSRALAGEEFDVLQRTAYEIAGFKTSGTTVTLRKIRRISLPSNHAWVMDLERGKISSVIADSNGYFIYKIRSKSAISVDQASKEIRATLRARYIRDHTESIQGTASTTLNEFYFRPQPEGQSVTCSQ